MRSRENVANDREVKSLHLLLVAPMYFPQVLAIAPKILNTSIVFLWHYASIWHPRSINNSFMSNIIIQAFLTFSTHF